METINKRHDEITVNRPRKAAAYFKVIDPKAVYFSAVAGEDFGIMPGLFMHFVNDGDRWYFYCNTETDGFKIVGFEDRKPTRICDVSLVALILKRSRVSIGAKFIIQPTTAKLNGCQLSEINFNKPIEK